MYYYLLLQQCRHSLVATGDASVRALLGTICVRIAPEKANFFVAGPAPTQATIRAEVIAAVELGGIIWVVDDLRTRRTMWNAFRVYNTGLATVILGIVGRRSSAFCFARGHFLRTRLQRLLAEYTTLLMAYDNPNGADFDKGKISITNVLPKLVSVRAPEFDLSDILFGGAGIADPLKVRGDAGVAEIGTAYLGRTERTGPDLDSEVQYDGRDWLAALGGGYFAARGAFGRRRYGSVHWCRQIKK